MALRLADKQAIVAEVQEVASTALSVVAAEMSGSKVGQMTRLRAEARKADVYLRVVKNTLAHRAVESTEFACIQPALVGQIILAFSRKEPGAAARLLRDFCKKNDSIQVRALAIGGNLLPASDLDTLANLPTRDEAIAMFLRTMNAPVTKLVRTMAETYTQIVRVISAAGDKK